MKPRLLLSVLLLAACCLGSCTKAPKYQKSAWQNTEKNYAINPVRDLVLIYQGGAHRIDWTKDQFVPYVTHTFADGRKNWLFDGFLFLEFTDNGKQLIPDLRMPNAQKGDWERYLDRVFEKGKSLDALNACIEEQKAELGDPGFKHKIVLTILPPLPHQKDWGELDGKALDFDNVEDAKAACQWFLNQLVDRFEKSGYNNLELSGIYWVAEDMAHNEGFTRHVSDMVHEKGLQFAWIPYYKASGYDRWQELGFDIAYYQPNFFFRKDIPVSRLDEACSQARQYGMGLELEFDARALHESEDSFYDRLDAYMDAYWRNNVFTDAAIAYYEGGTGFLDFLKNPTPENRRLIDRLATIIVERRNNNSLVPDTK